MTEGESPLLHNQTRTTDNDGSESITLTWCHRTLAAKTWGPRDGIPVLSLHGWLDNAASYDRLAPLFPEMRWVALELSGHGHSDHRAPDSGYHFVDWVHEVVGAADALGWQRFHLVGHSMGAGVASLLAGALPGRLDRLVLLEGLGPLTSPAEEAPQRLAQSILEAQRLLAKQPPPHRDQEVMAERLRAVMGNIHLDNARLLVRRGSKQVEGGWTWRSDPRLRGTSNMRFTEEHVLAFLRRIGVPTLLVWADQGYPFDRGVLDARAACIPDLHVAHVQGGHHVHMDDPQTVATHMRAFLAATQNVATAR